MKHDPGSAVTMEAYLRWHNWRELPDPSPEEIAEIEKRKAEVRVAALERDAQAEPLKYLRYGRLVTDSRGGYRRGRMGTSIT